MKLSETPPAPLGAAQCERGVRPRTERPRGDDRVPRLGAPEFDGPLRSYGPLRSFEATDLSSARYRKAAGEGKR
jgi:hypothetical protein